MSHKISKHQAGYEPKGHKDSHCGPTDYYGQDSDRGYCKHFIHMSSVKVGQCRIVLGTVEHKGWCKYFSKPSVEKK